MINRYILALLLITVITTPIFSVYKIYPALTIPITSFSLSSFLIYKKIRSWYINKNIKENVTNVEKDVEKVIEKVVEVKVIEKVVENVEKEIEKVADKVSVIVFDDHFNEDIDGTDKEYVIYDNKN